MTKDSWKYQREMQSRPELILDHANIVSFIMGIPHQRDSALMALLYLTGGRVSEVVKVIARRDIVFTVRSNREVMLVRMPNRKNKRTLNKTQPVPIDQERVLAGLIQSFISTFDDDVPIFDITPSRAWQITRKYGYNPHMMRHLRLTHLVIMYDFNEQLLIRFAGWTDGRPAKHYMELKWSDLLDKMRLVG